MDIKEHIACLKANKIMETRLEFEALKSGSEIYFYDENRLLCKGRNLMTHASFVDEEGLIT